MYCGRFIGHKEFDGKQVNYHYIPDTHFTGESIDWYHVSCRKKDIERTPEHLRPYA
jgi:hypothetical protein